MPASLEITSSLRMPAVRRIVPPRVVDIDALPASAMLTTRQVAALSGFAEVTLKVWRRAGGMRGPKVVRVEGRPRYRASDVRVWLAVSSRETDAA